MRDDLVDSLEIAEVDEGGSDGSSDKLVYPSVIIEGIELTEEIQFLFNYEFDASKSIPLFVKSFGVIKRIGSIEFTLDAFQLIRMIADYKLTLMKTPTDKVCLDLNDPNTLIKLIKL